MLIDDDCIADVLHDDVLVRDVRDKARGRRREGLDPQPVLGSDESGVGDPDPLDGLLRRVSPQAPDADPMAWPASDARDVHVCGPVAYGDAIVASGDVGVGDQDVVGDSDVDSVGIGAVAWGCEVDVLDTHALTPVHGDVDFLAVQ